jgi:uncharacterized damage-inducible protein DinB
MLYTPEGIAKLYAYSRWARAKMFESLAPLSPEELTRKLGGSFASIHATLAHVYGAEWVWLERWHGGSPRALPSSQDDWTLADFREKWRPVEEGHKKFVAAVTPEQLTKPLTYVNFAGQTLSYPLEGALVHVPNHGTYHRGQIATLLRQLGHQPVATDYVRYLDAGSPA